MKTLPIETAALVFGLWRRNIMMAANASKGKTAVIHTSHKFDVGIGSTNMHNKFLRYFDNPAA